MPPPRITTFIWKCFARQSSKHLSLAPQRAPIPQGNGRPRSIPSAGPCLAAVEVTCNALEGGRERCFLDCSRAGMGTGSPAQPHSHATAFESLSPGLLAALAVTPPFTLTFLKKSFDD